AAIFAACGSSATAWKPAASSTAVRIVRNRPGSPTSSTASPDRTERAMSGYAATVGHFTQWLRAYQAAWEGRDPAAAAGLFTGDARYFWTPLVPPAQGPRAIAAAW